MSGRDGVSGRSEASRNKFGWADDVVAPRQEVDRLSLLLEETAIQQALKADLRLAPETFLRSYRAARDNYRKSSTEVRPAAENVSEKTQALARFGAQASIQARREAQPRTALICSCPDGNGVLAALSEALADEGGNIMSAFMSIVGHHLIAAFLISGAEGSGIKPTVEHLTEIAERNRTPLKHPENIRIVSKQMSTDDGEYWARPGAHCWHASARYRGEGSLIRELTSVVADCDVPMIALSSWREADGETNGGAADESQPIQVVDLNLAIASDEQGGELKLVRDLEDRMRAQLSDVRLEIVPVRWPTRYRSHGDEEPRGPNEAVMTIVGQARPGFVQHSIIALERTEGVVKLRGCSMAILENVSVLTVVFDHVAQARLEDIREQAKTKLSDELTGNGHAHPTAVQVAPSIHSAACIHQHEGPLRRPTHALSIQAVEQPRVVAKVARLLASESVNITWFMSAVLNPVVGERWPICAIRMQLHIHDADEKAADVSRRLRDLAEAEDWQEYSFRPWSLDA